MKYFYEVKNLFYAHLVEIDSVVEELDKMNLTEEEKMHLASLLDSSLHHTVLDAIFAQLSESDKRIFARHVNVGDHDEIWKFLNEKVDNVEDKIKNAAEDLKKKLHEDIRKSKEV